MRRLREAVDYVVATCSELGQRVLQRAGPEESRIFDAQILMAQDEDFLGSVETLIRNNHAERRDGLRVQGARAPEPVVAARLGSASAWPTSTRSSSG